jgi:hypothetical protein
VSDPLFVQPDGLRSYSQIHDEVVAGLSHLMGTAAPEVAGVQTSHGAIASAVSTALSTVLGSRQGAMQTTATSGSTISELLKKAAQMYDQGDRKGAATLKAAAEALEGANAPGGTGAPGSPAAAGGTATRTPAAGAAGGDMMGQMFGQLGQVGQQVGQMAQAAGAPLQALAQPLQQFPQQVMQGVQQAVQRASQSAEKAVHAKDAGQADPTAPQEHSRGAVSDEPRHRAGAAPGESANTGRAPEPPRAEHAQPAQTRPQAD